MQEKSYKNSKVSLLGQIKSNILFFRPVVRNGWIIKFSIYDEKYILLTVVSKFTAQTFIRYFTDEMGAVNFINMIIDKNPHEVWE
jgi:hypothetical protein